MTQFTVLQWRYSITHSNHEIRFHTQQMQDAVCDMSQWYSEDTLSHTVHARHTFTSLWYSSETGSRHCDTLKIQFHTQWMQDTLSHPVHARWTITHTVDTRCTFTRHDDTVRDVTYLRESTGHVCYNGKALGLSERKGTCHNPQDVYLWKET